MGTEFIWFLAYFAVQSYASICDYDDCACLGETVSCRCERNTDFKLIGEHKTVPSNLTNFSLEECNEVMIGGGIFQGSNIADIDIRNSNNVTVETKGLTGIVLKHLGFQNLTLGLESDSINGNITILQFDSVHFPKSLSSVSSIGGRFEQLMSFVNCVSEGMGFFSDSLKVGEFWIENSTIDRIEQHNLKFDVMYNFVIKNSRIGHIEEGGIWPGWEVENWQGHQDVILLNNNIGVLEKDFFNGGGWRGRFKFLENKVHLVKEGALTPYYMEHINEIHIWNNSFANVEPYDITINLDYNRLYISGNQFNCNANLCTTLDQSVPVVKEFDVYSYFELLMFNNSQCIDEPHRYQTPNDVYGNFFDASECLESFGSFPENTTMMYKCSQQCRCFNHEAICTCSRRHPSMRPDFQAIPRNISQVTITNCSQVELYGQQGYENYVEHIRVKNVRAVTMYYQFLSSFEQLRSLKFKNVNLRNPYAYFSGGVINYGGVLTFDNVHFSVLPTSTFYSALSFGRLKILNSNIGSVEPHVFYVNPVMNTIIVFNTTVANVSEAGFHFKYLNHFRMGFCQLGNISSFGFNITSVYDRQVESIVIQSSSFGLISDSAFFTNNSNNLTNVRKVVFSDNTVDVLQPLAFNLWQNNSDELVFTNNTIYVLGSQTSTVSEHKTVVEYNQLTCDITLCSTLAQYFPYEGAILDDFFALLAFNQSTCITSTSSFSDTFTSRSKSVLGVYGRFRNTAECEQHFRNGSIA